MAKGKEGAPAAAPGAKEIFEKLQVIQPLRHFIDRPRLAGYSGPVTNFVMIVKEAVENMFDATEALGVLPSLLIDVKCIDAAKGTYRLSVADNGPGIPPESLETALCHLASTKAFRYLQARGQIGVGISVALGLSTKTQAKPIKLITKTSEMKKCLFRSWRLDYYNEKMVVEDEFEGPLPEARGRLDSTFLRDRLDRFEHGFVLEFYFTGLTYRVDVENYVRDICLIHPHAEVMMRRPGGEILRIPRRTEQMPPRPVEIKPPLEGITLGGMLALFKTSLYGTVRRTLSEMLFGATPSNLRKLKEGLAAAGAGDILSLRPAEVDWITGEKLLDQIRVLRMPAFREQCLSPIGVEQLNLAINRMYEGRVSFVDTVVRPQTHYEGNPTIIEAAIAEVQGLPKMTVRRYVNKTPLLLHESKDDIYLAVMGLNWRAYDITEESPVLVVVHIATTQAPFFSSAKTSLSLPDVMRDEIVLALQELGRRYRTRVVKREEVKRKVERGVKLYEYLRVFSSETAKLAREKKVPKVDPIVEKVLGKRLAGQVKRQAGKEE